MRAPASIVVLRAVTVTATLCTLACTSRASLDDALTQMTPNDFSRHLSYLASDTLEGRAPGTSGGEAAAEYLARELAGLGFQAAGDDEASSAVTYFQRVGVLESVTLPGSALRLGEDGTLKFSSEIVAWSGRKSSRVEVDGDVVFVGHGIVAPEYRWDDYASVDVTGKIALVMVNEPKATADEPNLFEGDALTYYGRWTYKLEEAARHGAQGAVLIHTDASATYPWRVVQASWTGPQFSLASDAEGLALNAWVTDEAARDLVRGAGKNLDDLRARASTRGGSAVPLGVRLSGALDRRVRELTSPNVIGVRRGTAPGGAVLVTAHYDHLGMREGDAGVADRIFNGAVDNASGVAGVLTMAKAWAAAPTPRHSIYIAFTTAEEAGLLGAEYLAAHLPVPMPMWSAVVNVDEVNVFGPTRDLVLIGSERSSSLGAQAQAVAMRRDRRVVPDPEPGQGNFFRSDHFPFAKRGVPALSLGLATTFVGADGEGARRRRDDFSERRYHQVTDEVGSDWDLNAAVGDLRLLAEIVWRLADAEAGSGR